MMQKISAIIDHPEGNDVRVADVFSEAMFNELVAEMNVHGMFGINETTTIWRNDYKNRKIISQFLKDGQLGKKRLASMPDRVTNTINLMYGPRSGEKQIFRPTVINCYSGDIPSIASWWSQWKTFMFDKEILTKTRDGKIEAVHIVNLLTPIQRSKYPAVSELEESVSIPLQTLSCAIFDAILVHVLTQVAPTWQVSDSE